LFTDRELKGYNFENLVDKSINGNNFLRNSVRGIGSDFKHEYYPIELEAKFSHAIIYPSWIKRDWLSRFSKDARFKVVVSNKGMKLNDECFRLLREGRVIYVYYDQLKDTVELLIALCSSEEVTSYRTNRTKSRSKSTGYSIYNVKNYSLSSFKNVDLSDDCSKFLFNQHKNSKLSKETIKLLKEIEDRNLPIEIIFINNQKEMDEFVESLKHSKDKTDDPNKYNENMDYKKEFSKTIKEIRKNKPKMSREEKELLKFKEQLKTSILEKGLLNKITLTNYGILDGEDRFKTLQELKLIEVPPFTNDLYVKEYADKYPQYFTWREVKDYKEFKELRVVSSLTRKPERKEIQDYCKVIDGTMPNEQICNYVIEKFSKYIPQATLYRWIPQQYKRPKFSNENYLPEGLDILQKPQTTTFSVRTTRSQKEKFYELCNKHGLKVNDVVKQLIDEWIKKMSSVQPQLVEQQPEIKQTIQQAQEILENNQEDKNVDYKPSKFDFCKVCNRTTRHIWNSFTQEYMCGECYSREISRVTKQTPSKIEIRKAGE
jgi:hypothetical protein